MLDLIHGRFSANRFLHQSLGLSLLIRIFPDELFDLFLKAVEKVYCNGLLHQVLLIGLVIIGG